MSDSPLQQVRDQAYRRAMEQWHAAMNVGTIVAVELVDGAEAPADVLRYGARRVKGAIRVGMIIAGPAGGLGAQYIGADVQPHEVARWFSVRGVPVVRTAGLRPM